MKRFLHLWGVLTLCLLPTVAWADTVSEDDAAAVAAGFFTSSSSSAKKSVRTSASSAAAASVQTANISLKRVELPVLEEAATENLFYVYQNENGEGWVMVAADDAVEPILAFSDEGTFSTENMPDNLKAWLGGYNEQIRFAIDNNLKATAEVEEQWTSLKKGIRRATAATVVVGPLIETKWDQEAPFNNLSPGSGTWGSGSTKAASGCVATAMSQVMNYWEWPEKGQGSKTYTPKDPNTQRTSSKYGSQSANFANTTYDWANMRNSYTGSYTTAQANAVATLLYHAAVSVEMMWGDYSDGGSGAYTLNNNSNTRVCAQNALWTYFKYDYDSIKSYMRSGGTSYGYSTWTDANWIAMLKKELDKKRPIMYSGSGSGGGHSFICDGYRSDNYFHFNWGWSGSCDGFYLLSNLAPASGGAGSAGLDFNSKQGVIIGIVPNVTETYTITYNAGSHATCATTTQKQTTVGQSFTLPAIASVDENWKFLGWSDVEGSSTPNVGVAGDTYTPMRNVTLYAVVVQDGYVVHFITDAYYTDGSQPTWTGHGTCEVDSIIENGEGAGIVLPNVSSDAGWTFQYWLVSSSSGMYIAGWPGDTYHPSGNTTLFAYWTEDAKVYLYYDLVGVTQTSGTSGGWITQVDGITATFTAADNYLPLTADNVTVEVVVDDEPVTATTSVTDGVLTVTLAPELLLGDVDITITATEDYTPCKDYKYTYTATKGIGNSVTLGDYTWSITRSNTNATASYSSTYGQQFGGNKSGRSTYYAGTVTYSTSSPKDCNISSISVNCAASLSGTASSTSSASGSTIEAFIGGVSLGSQSLSLGYNSSYGTYRDTQLQEIFWQNTSNLQGDLKFVIKGATSAILYVKSINVEISQSIEGGPYHVPVTGMQAFYYPVNDNYIWYTMLYGDGADFPFVFTYFDANDETSIAGTHTAYTVEYNPNANDTIYAVGYPKFQIDFKKTDGSYYNYYHIKAEWKDENGKKYYIDDDVDALLANFECYKEAGGLTADCVDSPTSDIDANGKSVEYTINYWQQNISGADYTLKESASFKTTSGNTVAAELKSYSGFTTPAEQSITVTNTNKTVNYYYDRRTYPVVFTVNNIAVQRDTVRYKGIPVFRGTDPVRQATDQYTFAFTGWLPYIAPINQSTTYSAQFEATLRSYTITWKNEDGTELKTDVVNYGETPEYTGETPTKAATAQYTYTFSGWSPEVESVTGEAEYTAQFTATLNQYTVSFNANGHGTAPDSQTINYGTAATAPAAPAETGYTFGGWFTDAACTTAWDFATTITGNVELFAKWTVNTHTLAWEANGGVLSGDYTSGTVAYGTAITAPAATRTGYDFGGWDKTVPETMPDNDLTLTAQWNIHTYNNLTFTSENEAKGMVSVEGGKATYQYGDKVTITADAKAGYTFAAWKNEDGVQVSTTSPLTLTIDDNTVSLVAYFTANTNTAYTVRHLQQNITDDDYTLAEEENKTGETATETAAAAKSYTGFTAQDFEQQTIAGDGTTVVEIRYNRNTYLVEFVVEGTTVQSQTLRYGATVTAPADPAKEKDAQYTYKFDGWTPAVSSTVTDNATYTAQFATTTNTYTVSFNSNGLGTAPVDQTVAYGGKVEKPADLSSVGYTFLGWFKEATLENAWDFDNDVVTGATTLFAKWQIHQWTLSWNANGGSITSTNHTEGLVNFGTEITAATAERTGYTFAGWDPSVPETMPDENLTLVAQWTAAGDTEYKVEHWQQNIADDDYTLVETENLKGATNAEVKPVVKDYPGFEKPAAQTANIQADGKLVIVYKYKRLSYTLTWDANGGTLSGDYTSGSVKYGASITAPQDPTRTGYDFQGWNPAFVEGTTMPNDNLTLTAQWKAKTYSGVIFQGSEGGEIEVEPAQTSYDYDQQVTLSAKAEDGYDFGGWQDEDGKTVSDELSFTYTITGDATVTAVFTPRGDTKYTVRTLIEQLDGSFAQTEVVKTDGTTGTLTNEVAADKEGFTAQTIEQQTIAGNGTTVVEVRYTRNSYTLTWNANGGTLSGDYTSGSVKFEAPIAEPEVAWAGHTFQGWDPEVPAIMPAGSLTLTAQWTTDTYTGITFESEDETKGTVTVDPEKTEYTYGDEVTVTASEKDGYHFAGWQDKDGNSVEGGATLTITIDENTESLVALFAPNTTTEYTVVHLLQNANNDEFTVYKTENKQGTTAEEVTPEVLTIEGFESPAAQTVEIQADGKLVVTYEYLRKLYTLIWDADGGAFENGESRLESEIRYGATITAPADPTKEGHDFLKWDNVPATMPLAEDGLTITAQWKVLTFTIRFLNWDGDKLLTLEDVEWNSPVEFTDDEPIRVQWEDEDYTYTYTFIGWVDEADNFYKKEDTLPKAMQDATYTAVLEETKQEKAHIPTGLEVVIAGKTITMDGQFRIYDYTGKDVTGLNGNLSRGAYIVVSGNNALKVMIP